VIANGNTIGELAVRLARVEQLVVVQCPRATVPSTSGCAEAPP
jgi:hypothetical protein